MSVNLDFEWSLSEKQADIFELGTRYRVGMCGRRFGKNEVATASLIDYALRPDTYEYGADENPICWWVGPTYTQTKKYGFQKTLEKLPEAIIDGQPKRSAPFEIPLLNGAQIEFYSFDRPSSLQGAGVDMMIIDEAAYMDETIWDNDLRPMLLDNEGGALLISKPIGENWFYDRYERAESDPEWGRVHATSYDNPWIPDAEIEKAKQNTPENVFRQEYLADPQAGGTLLTLDMLETAPASVLDGVQWQWHISVDLGVEMSAKKARENNTDYWALSVVAEHPRKDEAYVCEVRRTRGQAPSAAAEWISRTIEWLPTRRVKYEKVQAQAWFETHLQDHNLDPIPVTPSASKEDRIIGLSVPFSNGQVKLIDWSDIDGKSMDWSDFRTEWAGFPGDKVDQLDSLAMALDDVTFGMGGFAEGGELYER